MILRGPRGFFQLDVVSGPDSEGWCRVHVHVESPEGSWSARDACLQRSEVGRLAAWLQAVAEQKAGVGQLDFTEPELSFAFDGKGSVSVHLSWNLLPSWAAHKPETLFCLEYPAEPGQLLKAAASLHFWLERHE